MSTVTTTEATGPKSEPTDLKSAPTSTGNGRRTNRRRTVKRALGITALALAVAAAGGYSWLDATSDVRNLGQTRQNVMERLSLLWDSATMPEAEK